MIHVKTMLGLGDAFAARPTIAALDRKQRIDSIETPWPEALRDLVGEHTKFVRPRNLNIRCANRNVEESKLFADDNSDFVRSVAGGLRRIQLSYSLHKGCKDIPTQIAESAGVMDSVRWEDFFIDPIHDMNRFERLGVFRQPTVRKEYHNISRNCEPGTIPALLRGILKTGLADAIHVNDLHFDAEILDEPRIEGACAIGGEFALPTLIDFVKRARFVLSPVSWLAWCGLAHRIPTLVVFGGYCGPDTIFGPILEREEAACFRLLKPLEPCLCYDPRHGCQKRIADVATLEAMGQTFGEMLDGGLDSWLV